MTATQQRKTANTIPPGSTPPPPGGRGIPLLRGMRPSGFMVVSGLLILVAGMASGSAVLVVLGILWFALPALLDWLLGQRAPRTAGRGPGHTSRTARRRPPGEQVGRGHLRRIK